MSSKSAATLLAVAKSHTASDVMEFCAEKKKQEYEKAQSFHRAESDDGGKKKETHRPPSSVIVVDSNMTPLEAATLLWENNM